MMGGPYSESTPQIIKVKQSQGYLPDIIGVRFTYKNCDPEYNEGILLEYRYLLLLHGFQQPALTQILHPAFAGCIVTSCQEKKLNLVLISCSEFHPDPT